MHQTNPPPGRIVLPPGGDNITYAHSEARRQSFTHNADMPQDILMVPTMTPKHNPGQAPSATTHIGKWQVKRVVQHRGKITHRTKLQFRVQWEPLEGKVSPDTWIPWNQARWLSATREYIQSIPLMHYLVPLMPTDAGPAEGSTSPPSLSEFANSTTGVDGKPLRYNRLMKGSDAAEWIEASAQEIDRLVSTTKTMHFIRPENKPHDRLASYYNPQCSIKHGKDKRVRGTYGGDRSDYTGAVSANTAAHETVMVLLNATISERAAFFTTADIKDFFLMSDLARPEYMWLQLNQIPERIQRAYNIADYAVNDRVMVEITKGIYGLPQAALLAKQRLDAHLAAHGYHESSTPCLYKHTTRPIMFTLVVDDFGIKAHEQQHLDHLLNTLRLLYTITTGDGSKYPGMTLEWDYRNRTVSKSMPGHLAKNLKRFNVILKRPTYTPGGYVAPQYGSKAQQMAVVDESAPLTPEQKKTIQEIIGAFLYYARVIDSTMLKKVNELGSLQATATENVARKVDAFLQYAATYPVTKVTYHASDMTLHTHSDASYLGESKSRSRFAGFHFLGQQHRLGTIPTTPINGGLLIRSSILDVVVSSAAEAELGGLFENMRDATTLRNILADVGYPQSASPIQTDNKCAEGIAHGTVKSKRSKAFDMRYHWVRDRVHQGQFDVYWREGGHNLADYFTKDHPAAHHKAMRPYFISS